MLIEQVAFAGSSEARLLDALARTPAELTEIGTFGRYTLERKLACTLPEQCFEVHQTGCFGDGHYLLRTFPRFEGDCIARHRAWAKLDVRGIARIVDFGAMEGRPFVLGEYALGVDLRRLRSLRPPLALVLAMIAEGLETLRAIHAQGASHGHLSAGRIRIEPLGAPRLCLGTSEPAEEGAAADRCTLVRLLLDVCENDRRLHDVLRTREAEALVVAADRLEELYPELDELISAVLIEERPLDRLLPLLSSQREQAAALVRRLVEATRDTSA